MKSLGTLILSTQLFHRLHGRLLWRILWERWKKLKPTLERSWLTAFSTIESQRLDREIGNGRRSLRREEWQRPAKDWIR